MSWYKNMVDLHHTEHQAFDSMLAPGELAPYSGIYKCQGCGFEVLNTEGQPLPADTHQEHPAQCAVQWRLISAIETKFCAQHH